MNQEELKAQALKFHAMEAKYYDPNLDDDDITLNVLGDYDANFDGP